MNNVLRPITALLLSATIVLMGSGLLGIVVPLRADIEAFSDIWIGLLGSGYFAGLLIGSLVCIHVIRQAGHIRAFAVFTAIGVAGPLLHAIYIEPFFWLSLRVLTGVCLAGLTIVIESWLNMASTSQTRGRVLALYTALSMSVAIVGQQLVNIAEPQGFQLFSLVAILISLAAVPIALTRSMAPELPPAARLRLIWLFEVSPAAAAGCLVAGLATGPFWALGPLYAHEAGLDTQQLAVFMSLAVAGGAISQWPLGWWSDRRDRRSVLLAAAAMGSAAGTMLAVLGWSSVASQLLLVFVFGGAVFPIYAISVAHANDRAVATDMLEVSSNLLFLYAIGAIAGPVLAALTIELVGYAGLFAYSGAILALFVVTSIRRRRIRPIAPRKEQTAFVAVPRTSPAVFGLDPRMDSQPRPSDRFSDSC